MGYNATYSYFTSGNAAKLGLINTKGEGGSLRCQGWIPKHKLISARYFTYIISKSHNNPFNREGKKTLKLRKNNNQHHTSKSNRDRN